MAKSEGYIALADEEDGTTRRHIESAPASRWREAVKITVVLLGMLGMLVFGYFLGVRQSAVAESTTIIPPGDQHYYMHFNGTFPQRSNPESDAAWDALFPEKLGFVQHPELAPNVAGIAVFHELHCLNILRSAFWASVDGKLKEMGAEDREKNHRTSHHHIRHCFEYLRQSLICLADSNLENMNYTVRGVSGWQTERTCRSIEKITDWANEWGISREEALHNFDLQANFSDEGPA